MKASIHSIFAFAIFAALASGCATQHGDVYGTPGDKTGSSAVAETLGIMLSDPGFAEMYDNALKVAADREQKKPTIAVMPIEDNTSGGNNDAQFGGQPYVELKTALRRTGKFTIIDYRLMKVRGPIDIGEPDIGIKPTNVGNFGSYTGADFLLLPELIKADSKLYFLNMSVIAPDGTVAIDGSAELKR